MTVVTAQQRDRMEAVRQRLKDARTRQTQARKAVEAAQSAGDEDARHVAQMRLDQARDDIELVQELESTLLSQMAGVSFGGLSQETFLNDPEAIRALEQWAESSMPIGQVNLGPVMSRDEVVASFQRGRMATAPDGLVTLNTGDDAREAPFWGIVPQLRRKLRLLDLIPSAPLANKTLPYVRETGSLDTAAETAESALKPAGQMGLEDAEATAKTIAHWMKVPRQILSDVAGLGTAIQTRLFYGIERRLESGILSGDGTGENLQGILNTTGIAEVVYDPANIATDQALLGITDVLLSNAQPTGVVLNPRDWQQMLWMREGASDGSWKGEYLSMGPFLTTAQALWGVPIVLSPAIAQGTALVGDFTIGATVFIREGVVLRASDAADDDFTRNRVTFLAEGRFALAVWQPAAFAIVHLTA